MAIYATTSHSTAVSKPHRPVRTIATWGTSQPAPVWCRQLKPALSLSCGILCTFGRANAVHEVSSSNDNPAAPAGAVGRRGATTTAISGHPRRKWGGAVSVVPGDDPEFDWACAVGHTRQVVLTGRPSLTFEMCGSSQVAYQRMGDGAASGAVHLANLFGGDGNLVA
jgi:hypothetical protein